MKKDPKRVFFGEVFAGTKVKLLCSEVCAKLQSSFYAQVKLSPLRKCCFLRFAVGKTSLSAG